MGKEKRIKSEGETQTHEKVYRADEIIYGIIERRIRECISKNKLTFERHDIESLITMVRAQIHINIHGKYYVPLDCIHKRYFNWDKDELIDPTYTPETVIADGSLMPMEVFDLDTALLYMHAGYIHADVGIKKWTISSY